MKNILITGGLGFIGTNLADRLLKDGHRVYLVDDLSTGRMRNLFWLKKNNHNDPYFLEMDITDEDFMNRLWHYSHLKHGVDLKSIDQIYHLACPASPPKYYLDPLKTLDINYIGTRNVLDVANYYKARILFSSTSEVYGDPLVSPQSEDYTGNVNPVSPRSVYDEGKRVAETLVSEYHRQFGLETKIARIFNTFGPRMDPDDGRVVTNFIKQYLEGNPFTIYGTGDQTRSFCYISDQIDGLILLMNSDKFINEPVNIGSNFEITIFHLCAIIAGSWTPNTEIKPMPISDPAQRRADISKMKSIGWNPEFGIKKLVEEVSKTIEYMREELYL